MVAAAPQLPTALGTKKKGGNAIVTLLTASQLTIDAGSAVAVVKAKVADCAVFPAMRFPNGEMFIETAVTWLSIEPTVPVAVQTL